CVWRANHILGPSAAEAQKLGGNRALTIRLAVVPPRHHIVNTWISVTKKPGYAATRPRPYRDPRTGVDRLRGRLHVHSNVGVLWLEVKTVATRQHIRCLPRTLELSKWQKPQAVAEPKIRRRVRRQKS